MNKNDKHRSEFISQSTFVKIIILLLVSIYALMWGNKRYQSWKKSQEERSRIEYSCEAWRKHFVELDYNRFSQGTLHVDGGDIWVINLDPLEWSGWLVANARFQLYPESNSKIEIEDPNGFRITLKLGEYVRLRGNTYRLRGDDCALVSAVKRTK